MSENIQNLKTSPVRVSDSVSNIAPAMIAIQGKIKPIKKEGYNESQRYSYAKFEDYIESIKTILFEEGLTTVTSVGEPKRLEPRPTRSGGHQYPVEVAITVRILHKSGEWMEIDCYGEGQDTGDKGIYKAVTGGRKYALACLLNLATTDDPEDDSDQKPVATSKQTNHQYATGQNSRQGAQNNKPATNVATKQQSGTEKANGALKQSANKDEGMPQFDPATNAIISGCVDTFSAAKDMAELQKNFAKGWGDLKHNPVAQANLQSFYEARKKDFQQKS